MRSYLDAENTSRAAEFKFQHRLHPLGEMRWNASQRCITIVQPLQNEGRNQ